MRVDTNWFGTVPMDDAGEAGPVPTDRRYGNADYRAAYEHLVHWAQTCDRLGYDTMWFTEHHFQYEGYEVIPNQIQFGQHVVSRTERLRCGQMFNVVPQWHPLRLAEDFALADLLTGGRMEFGVGRGTVPREAQTLGTVVASGDNEMSDELDRINREVFEEAVEVIKLAWGNERFAYTGKHFVLPPPGIPDRGGFVADLTLVPRPDRPIDIYQPISSPDTALYVPAVGHKAVYWLGQPAALKRKWDHYAEVAAQHGREVAPGADRCLVLNVHIGPTHEAAIASARDGHDEYVRFLAPYGRFGGYTTPEGDKVPFGFRPTVEDSIAQEVMAIGSVDDVVDVVGRYAELLDLQHLCCFFDFPGLSVEAMDEQLELLATEVMPRLGVTLEPRPLPGRAI